MGNQQLLHIKLKTQKTNFKKKIKTLREKITQRKIMQTFFLEGKKSKIQK